MATLDSDDLNAISALVNAAFPPILVRSRTLLGWSSSITFETWLRRDGSAYCDWNPDAGKITPVNTYYVNGTTGNDTTGDGSSGNPFATIVKAITTGNVASVASQINIVDTADQEWGNTSPQQSCNIIANSLVNVVAPSGERAGYISTAGSGKQYYLENLVFDGNSENVGGALQVTVSGTETRLVGVNCQFNNGGQNGLDWNGDGEVYLKDCTCDGNVLDGFNYHDSGSSDELFILEDNCTATDNGSGASSSNNGSTVHEATNIVRVGGAYSGSPQIIVDIGTSDSINLGLTVSSPTLVSSIQRTVNSTSTGLQLFLGGSYTGGDFVVSNSVFEEFATISSVSGTKRNAINGTHYLSYESLFLATKAVTDDLGNMITDSGTATPQFTADATALAATSLLGDGARTVTVTVDDGTDPVEGAKVRLTNGATSYIATTNASGVATFNVDDATWTVAITKAGYSYAGTTLVVDGDETPTYSMTQVVITPSEAGFSTGYATVYDENGDVESGVSVTVRCVAAPIGSGLLLDSAERTVISNGSGLVEFANMIQGAKYEIQRAGDGDSWRRVIVPATSTFALDNYLGKDS